MACVGKVQVGKPAPHFEGTAVVDGRFKEVSLSSYTEANHWVILIFFPKAWSFICPTEIRAFSARLEEFLYSRSCAVVFCSTDSEHCLKAWNGASEMEGGLGGIHVPMLSDCNHAISRDFGVLIEEEGVAQRALFIIDPKGMVRAITINDADVGRSVDEAQRVLDALVFKDEFGEGCPVGWKKGVKGISTNAQIEGKVELKKSWSEWARPKLARTWSENSQRSIGSFISHNRGFSAPTSEAVQRDTDGVSIGLRSAMASSRPSPVVSPTSAGGLGEQMEDVMLARRIENAQANLRNQVIGVAN